MNKTYELVKLDLLSVIPYISVINIAVQISLGLFVGFLVGTSLVPFAMIMGLGAGYFNLVFAVGERNRLDILHATFNLSRRDIVLGRYAYVAFINIAVAVSGFLLVFFAARLIGVNWPISFLAVTAVIISFQYFLIAAVQTPIYFRSGYAGARAFSSLPYIMYISVFALIMLLNNIDGWAFIAENALIISAVLVFICAAAFILSFYISCKFYYKRDL